MPDGMDQNRLTADRTVERNHLLIPILAIQRDIVLLPAIRAGELTFHRAKVRVIASAVKWGEDVPTDGGYSLDDVNPPALFVA